MPKKKTAVSISTADQNAANKQIKNLQAEVKYDTRDFVVGYIVEQFRIDYFYIPHYQREYIWRDHHRRRFIESVLLGLPIPMMFVAEIEDDGRLEVVDGAQRIQTLESFMNNDLKLDKLDILTKLNGFRFEDLPKDQQNKFRNKAMRIVVLDPSTSVETRKEIFRRVNISGEKARSSEVRRGAFEGPFMKFIETCANDPLFQRLCPVTESYKKRREPQELVLRFFAYSDRYKTFRHDVGKFLDTYVQDHQKKFEKARMKREFQQMLKFVDQHFPYGMAKQEGWKTTPRVRFEAIAVGVNLAIRSEPDLCPPKVNWLDSEEFKIHTTSHATNSRPKLRGRVEYVRDQLLGKGN